MSELKFKFILSVILIAGCTQSTEPESINLTGEWNWIQSTGGFARQTLTPESEDITQKFIFEGSRQFTFHQNSEVMRSGTYSLIDIRQGNTTLTGIEFSDTQIQSIIEEIGDTLKLRENCADCFIHWYKESSE